MFVIAIGDPFEGIEFFGPFDSEQNAIDWAESEARKESWWLVQVQEP